MKQLALLTDRIRFNEGRPQVYGTVLEWNENGILDCDLESPDQVDERRLAVGLEPFGQAAARQRDAVAAEGGKAPEDMAAYRESAARWAIQVGWRSE